MEITIKIDNRKKEAKALIEYLKNLSFVEIDSEKLLLKNILKDTDPKFFAWAINEIVNWKNETIPENIIHIHGNKDRIIPFKNVKADFVIEGGGHFMTVNKAGEIEKIIKSVIKKDSK